MLKRSPLDTTHIMRRAEELIGASSNRYRVTVQVANRARRGRYEDFDHPDDPMMKPVLRAIIEMSDELSYDEIIGDEAYSIGIVSNLVEPRQLKPIKPSISKEKPVNSPPLATRPIAPPALSPEQIQIAEINASVSDNPQLQQLKQESNLQAWEQLVNWISEEVCEIDFDSARNSVERLKDKYGDKSLHETARVLIVHKSLQAAGVDLIKGIPKAEAIIAGLIGYKLPEIMKISAEMVYQIADIYGFELEDRDRKIEALAAFGAAFLGEQAIEAGIGWLKYDPVTSTIISASAKALMIFAVGDAACLFYEAKLNSQVDPLSSSVVLDNIKQESQQYLNEATSEEAIIKLISKEINTALIDDVIKPPLPKPPSRPPATHPTALIDNVIKPPLPKPPSQPPATRPIAPPALSPKQIQIAEINASVNANPQLRQLKQESNLQAWEQLVNWISEEVCEIDFASARNSAERLKDKYGDKSSHETARILIVHKSLQAAGVDLIKGIPKAEAIIAGLIGYELLETMKISTEMVYQIADIYGFKLKDLDRKIETLATFGAAFLGEQAIEAGIGWLKYDPATSKRISALAKALMIFAVGNAACLFYEAKLKSQVDPLSSSVVLNKIRQESQQYLNEATSEDAIIKLIFKEINTALAINYTQLSNLLKASEWKKADQETRYLILKLANRNAGGSLGSLPSEDLRIINQIWLDNSNGYFGFSVQKQIYLSSCKQVGDFGEKVGWRGEAGMFKGILGWKSYSQLTFNLNEAPKGHLPAFWLDKPCWHHKGHITRSFTQFILERNDW